MPPLPLWERSDRIADAIRVRGHGLSIDLNPSPQPSPTRGEGAHCRRREIEFPNWTDQGLTAICRRAIEQWAFASNISARKANMPVRLDSRSADFAGRFAGFLATRREVAADIEAATRAIVDDVAGRGDAALIE